MLIVMTEVGVHEAKTQMSALLRRVEAGEEIIILRGREPIAKLVPIKRGDSPEFGKYRGQFPVPEDFDVPLSDQLIAEFYG